MQLEDYFDFLSDDDIRVKGTRIGVETILYDYLYKSRSPEDIADCYRSLKLEQVFATLTYYLANKQSMDSYLKRWIEHNRNMRKEQARNPSEAVRRIREAKQAKEVSVSTG